MNIKVKIWYFWDAQYLIILKKKIQGWEFSRIEKSLKPKFKLKKWP
jgi:hypothetical protein